MDDCTTTLAHRARTIPFNLTLVQNRFLQSERWLPPIIKEAVNAFRLFVPFHSEGALRFDIITFFTVLRSVAGRNG
jgi:hypothetical protein